MIWLRSMPGDNTLSTGRHRNWVSQNGIQKYAVQIAKIDKLYKSHQGKPDFG